MCAARHSSSFESYSGGPLVFGALSVLLFQESFISDCYTQDSGGAFSVQLGRLACTDSVIARCTAANKGGAIDVGSGGIVHLTRLRVEACSATKGGALAVGSGGIVHLTLSRVEACSAGSAGGVYISGSTSEFIVTDSSFDHCTCRGSGGALAIEGGHARITGGRFASCSSTANGGVLYVQGADANALLDGCTMVDVGGPTQSCNGTAAKFAPRSCHGAPWLRSLWRLSRGSRSCYKLRPT